MPAGVAGTIILIFVLLPCRGDKNDEKEGEKEDEEENGGLSWGQGGRSKGEGYLRRREKKGVDESSFA